MYVGCLCTTIPIALIFFLFGIHFVLLLFMAFWLNVPLLFTVVADDVGILLLLRRNRGHSGVASALNWSVCHI